MYEAASASPWRNDPKSLYSGIAVFLLFGFAAIWSLCFITTDAHQGDVYRIIYLHVPSAFAAFFCSVLLFVASVLGLRSQTSGLPLLYGKACAEVGLLFTAITLATGSIWGKPTWGVWWTWDARLTTTFILALLYCGYLLLWSALPLSALKGKVCSVLGLLIFLDVPLIYKSVTWWRTLHQPPSLMRQDGPTMAGEMVTHLLLCAAVTLGVVLWFIWQRSINLRLKERVEAARYQQMVQTSPSPALAVNPLPFLSGAYLLGFSSLLAYAIFLVRQRQTLYRLLAVLKEEEQN